MARARRPAEPQRSAAEGGGGRCQRNASNSFFGDNFPNDGQRFVAWYLHRVLLLDVHETRAAITDGHHDKQIDAIVVEDGEERRIRIIQGKLVKPEPIDAEPLREVLSA